MLRAGPDPALEALGFYVGNWNQTGTSRIDARSDYKPLTGSETCSWVEDNTAVVCRESVSDVSGTSDSLYFLSWDRAQQIYTVRGTDYANGSVVNGSGRLEGRTWVWDLVSRRGADRTALRFVFLPGDGGTRTLTVSLDDGTGRWPAVQRVTYTRTTRRMAPPVRRSMSVSPRTSQPGGYGPASGDPPPPGSAPDQSAGYRARASDSGQYGPGVGGGAAIGETRSTPPAAPRSSGTLKIPVPQLKEVKKPRTEPDKPVAPPKLLPEGERPGQHR